MKVCCLFSLEPPHRGNSNENTQQTIIYIKKKFTRNIIMYAAMFFLFVCLFFCEGFKKDLEIMSHGKRAVSVRATGVLL